MSEHPKGHSKLVVQDGKIVPVHDADAKLYTTHDLKAAVTAALADVAKHHQMHLIFSAVDGRVVKASCSCGLEFDASQPQCPQWEAHILTLITADAQAALAERFRTEFERGRIQGREEISKLYDGTIAVPIERAWPFDDKLRAEHDKQVAEAAEEALYEELQSSIRNTLRDAPASAASPKAARVALQEAFTTCKRGNMALARHVEQAVAEHTAEITQHADQMIRETAAEERTRLSRPSPCAVPGHTMATWVEGPCKEPECGCVELRCLRCNEIANRLQVELEARGQVIAANDRLRIELAETAERTRELREHLERRSRASHLANHSGYAWEACPYCATDRALLAGEGGK